MNWSNPVVHFGTLCAGIGISALILAHLEELVRRHWQTIVLYYRGTRWTFLWQRLDQMGANIKAMETRLMSAADDLKAADLKILEAAHRLIGIADQTKTLLEEALGKTDAELRNAVTAVVTDLSAAADELNAASDRDAVTPPATV